MTLYQDMRPYQADAVRSLLNRRRIIVGDAMSMGKCLETIAAKPLIDEEIGYRPALVICPPAVAPHWEEEIKKWHYKGNKTGVARLSTLKHLKRDLARAAGAEWNIGTYALLSDMGKNAEALDLLQRQQFGFCVLDEGHALSNPDSLRTQASRPLVHSIPFLSILTGTPIPNTLTDIYSQFNLLNPEIFPLGDANADAVLYQFYQIVRNKPHLVRDIMQNQILRRTPDKYLDAKMPLLEARTLSPSLTGEHEQVYLAVYENDDVPVVRKLPELQKILIDPNLTHPRWLPESLQRRIGKMRSCTLDAFEEAVRDAVEVEHGKVLGFTDLKEQVMPLLMQRFNRYHPLAMTHEVSSHSRPGEISPREQMRRKFQSDPECRFMASTQVMDVGVDLTGATHVFHLTLPYMPATLDQRISRSQRVTAEIEKEKVVSVVINPKLANGAPTVSEGIMQLLDDKRRIIDYLLESPEKLTLDDLQVIKNGHPENSPAVAGYLSPKTFMDWHFASLRGRGGARILSEYNSKPWIAQNLARAYTQYWDGYYGGNANTLAAAMVKHLLHGAVEGTAIVDICSGPFSLSRRLGVPITNLDLNQYMLDAGRLLEQQGFISRGNKAFQGLADELLFRENEFQLANCSLALHMSTLEDTLRDGCSERERILREAHRVARDFYVFTLPHTVIHQSDIPSFSEGLQRMGWDVLPQTGFYRGLGESTFRVFLGALQKSSAGNDEPVPIELLTWKMDRKLEGRKKKGRTLSRRKQPIPKKKNDMFELVPEFVHEDSGETIRLGGGA